MADNVTLPGTGVVVAADDVSSVWYQQVKLVSGTLGETAAIPGDATNGLDVDVTRVIPGTAATNLGKAVDTAMGATDTGVLALAVQKATAASVVGTDGDVAPLEVNATGNLYTYDKVAGDVLGTTAGAKVITDANGTIQQYLRGLISLMIDTTPSATTDAGPSQTIVRTYTTSADITTAAAITAAPTGGQKIVATDIMVSSDTAMLFSIQMETSANVLAAVRLPANGSVQISLRGYLKGDAADKKIYGKASVAGNVYITAVYFSEA